MISHRRTTIYRRDLLSNAFNSRSRIPTLHEPKQLFFPWFIAFKQDYFLHSTLYVVPFPLACSRINAFNAFRRGWSSQFRSLATRCQRIMLECAIRPSSSKKILTESTHNPSSIEQSWWKCRKIKRGSWNGRLELWVTRLVAAVQNWLYY